MSSALRMRCNPEVELSLFEKEVPGSSYDLMRQNNFNLKAVTLFSQSDEPEHPPRCTFKPHRCVRVKEACCALNGRPLQNNSSTAVLFLAESNNDYNVSKVTCPGTRASRAFLFRSHHVTSDLVTPENAASTGTDELFLS